MLRTVLVHGPYLVRNASLSNGGRTLDLIGDTDMATKLEVLAGDAVNAITWNGKEIMVSRSIHGGLTGTLSGPTMQLELPALSGWKVHDTLPEREPSYDDSWWIGAYICF